MSPASRTAGSSTKPARCRCGRTWCGGPLAVVDAKYKAERPSGFLNADVYQMLAYCVRLGLSVGHLVCAAGNEAGATHRIVNAGVTVRAHTLDLDQPPAALLAEIAALAQAVDHHHAMG